MSEPPRRIVVTGASGNVGAGVLRALARHEPGAEVVGVCRRPPRAEGVYAGVRWLSVDLSMPDAAHRLGPAMQGADVVIHLALALAPLDDADYLFRANVQGSIAVLDAMECAGVRHLVYASSLGVYAPAPARPVTESWPASGQDTSTYSRHKVAVEALLDAFEEQHPEAVVARFRPTVVVQRQAAAEIRSLYLGPFVPQAALKMLRRRALPVLPLPANLALQFVHADDVGDAVVALMRRRARGSYNVAADVLDSRALADLVGARAVGVNPAVMRAAVAALHRAGLIAVTPGWYDVATRSPLMDTSKARVELEWTPHWSSADAARELIDGLADGATGPSAALGLGRDELSAAPDRYRTLHDVSLFLWWATSVLNAVRRRPVRVPQFTAMAVNLLAGTPAAILRVRRRRRDAVAVAAPVAVAAAVVASLRGGTAAAAATTVLGALGVAERTRVTRKVR